MKLYSIYDRDLNEQSVIVCDLCTVKESLMISDEKMLRDADPDLHCEYCGESESGSELARKGGWANMIRG